MENSMNSMSRSPAISPYEDHHHHDDDTHEESSWTMYFEDFSNNNNMINDTMDDDDDESSLLSFSSDINYQSSSLVSDAACSAAKRHAFGASGNNQSCNRLSFKKRKAEKGGSLVDYDLEDTASSPVNSPKVCNLVNHFDKNLKQKHVMDISHQEKGSASSSGHERNDELNYIDHNNGSDQLKKRGLCLVPLSMVVQYLG
ncbi:hypothetical protein COLO4_09606 [Corchorus olitorius]|uniref:Uncharacterized protein n=1 Tax=Corchorus olitorius TaxID=93759 RepID=A0A1R3KBL1_9ROSI|nr:hypothetical protein COLO4_09606 [Corchorus olitorius]